MGFIGRLLTGLGSALMVFVGSAHTDANATPGGEQQKQQFQGIQGGAAILLAGFIADTGDVYTEQTAEQAIRRIVDGMSPDRVTDLPDFVRGLRRLELDSWVEVAAVETLITLLEERSGLLFPPEQVAAVTGQIFDEFVEPIMIAERMSPRGKFRDEADFPGRHGSRWQGQKRGQPFQPS